MIICSKNNKVCEYNQLFLNNKDNVIIASYFSASDIEYLKKIGITPILFQGEVNEAKEIFKELNIPTTKPTAKNLKRGIGCGRGYSNGKGFGKI